jgi:hypothetical protein
VIFGDEDGAIGAGCVRELADAIAIGVPVAGFDIGHGLREIRVSTSLTSTPVAANGPEPSVSASMWMRQLGTGR